MNENRRKRLRSIIGNLEAARTGIETIRDEEDEARDNMPENFLESDRYTDSEAASESMDSAIDSIDEAVSKLEEVV